MVVVGEAFLSAFLQVLFDRLASRELLNFARREGLRKKLDKWRKTLKRIQAVLDDADEKQHTDKEVKQWLDDLRDLAYDVEDILDEFVTDDLRRKLTGGNQASTSKARKLISWNPRAFMIKYRLESKIKEIDARFKDIVAQKGELNLGENVGRMSCETKRMLAPTSLVNEAHVYGRDKDKEAVLELLLNENCSGAEVSVIPILGMGGMGKTTLAQLIYNDEKVQSSFDLKAWACVSEDFDAVRVTKSILKSTTFASRDDNDLNLLQVELKEKLQGKKFLIVLDDLWNENYNDWTILRAPFEAGAPGSRIVITTRNQEVSSITGTIPAYLLQVLSNDACLSVFTQHALGASDFSAHANLQHIGEEIVKKCKGLPLAAKTLGGLLRTKLDCDEWEDVLKSKIWDIPEERSGIVPALMLSYHHLPSHLKRCFAYCSILPKDYDFEKKQLVLIWMAEGLIQPQENEKQMEDLGSEYFHSLLSRSFFQQSSIRKSRFVMHDLINDLAQWVAGDICFRMEDRFEGINEGKISKKARHSSYLDRNYDDATKKFGVFFELTRLRTFLPLMLPNLLPVKPRKRCYFPNLPQLLPKLRCLRVLSFHGYYITELPDSIGDLKHLRYLDLSYTRIRGLPESTTSLCNLQTLILKECCYLEELPSKLGNLVKLRHLNILNAYRLKGMPPQIGKLTCLQTLPHLFVGNNSCSGVNELGPLLHLRKTLIISRLENAIEPRDARDAKLIEKPNLTTLCLEWSRNIDESQDRTIEAEVLNMLQPHKALKELTIMSYGGIEFPTWLRGHSFPDMVLLRIENCKNCTSLPPIGQLPSLKYLFIEGMASVKNVGVEFYGESCSQPFRSLETLCFENMKEWDSWSPCGEFPNLRKLSIQYCPKLLGKLPNHLPSLKKVLISGCQWLVVSISSFPELCELEIEGSKGVVHRNKVDFSSLNSKSLSTISEFRCPIEGFILDVEDLALGNCEELMALWSNDVRLLQTLPCLRVLRICNWPKLVSLVAEEVKEQLQLGLPSTLRKIYISHCNGMESLPKAMMYNYTFVEHIEICECDSLTHFATGQLPSTLKGLKISECKNMLILLDEDDTNICSSNTSLLEYLIISDCPSLKSLIPSGELPATLKHLRISSCGELESIAKSFPHNSSLESIWIYDCENLKFLPMGIHTLSHLDKVEIRSCPTLVSFPDGGLLPGNLRVLMISNCEEMQVLPNCIHNITSLQELRIWKCPSIVSFPEEGFPINLTSLEICDCNITEALLEWGLHMLTSLQQLKISGGCPHLVSFPEMLLPASLTTLTIINFPNLKCLSSKGFQELASLKTLRISCCANLVSFLENVLSPSLLDLRIDCCEKLTSFPEDGLPRSLLTLSIWHCPLLKERCKKDQGQEWFKIAHIPCVLIDGKFIYDPERGK